MPCNVHGVVVGLSREFLIGIIVGILRLELLGFARDRAAQIFGEAVERFFGAQWHKNIVGLDGFAAAGRACP